jgi:hypothetical protein
LTLERAAVLYVIFAPFAIAGGAGITSAHGGPWWAGAANGCMLVFMAWVFTGWIILFIQARQSMVSTVDTTIDTAPEPAAPMRQQAAPPGYTPLFASESAGFAVVDPPLPEYFNWRVARRVAWAVTRRGEPLTEARLKQVMSKTNAARLMDWMLEQRLTKKRHPGRTSGVVPTGAGNDWMESIIIAFGPPPPRIDG